MPLSPQHRRRALHAAADNHPLANADQNLTEVDARLTKVDKTCHRQPPLSTPPAAPNNPEQIRTNLNKPEHRQTPRPDRTTPRITPKHPEKKNPEHRRRPPSRHSYAPPPSFLRRQEPTAPQHSFPAPFPNSSLPPSRGEVRWGVRGRDRPLPPTFHPRPIYLPSPPGNISTSPPARLPPSEPCALTQPLATAAMTSTMTTKIINAAKRPVEDVGSSSSSRALHERLVSRSAPAHPKPTIAI